MFGLGFAEKQYVFVLVIQHKHPTRSLAKTISVGEICLSNDVTVGSNGRSDTSVKP
jgi:hypothetical protein